MGKTDEDKMNVDTLCEMWTQKQRNFEMDIRCLLDKSKRLSQQLSKAAVDESKSKTLSQQQYKLDELMIHLTEELQRRHDEASAKKRLQEWHKTLDKMRVKIRVISQTLEKVGLTDKKTIDKLCETEDYTQHHYELLSLELQRCETLRHENLNALVDHLWAEINQWSEMTLQYPTVHKYRKECCTEDLLEVLEKKLADLQRYYNSNIAIFELYAKRVKLWTRMEALEEKAKEPNRYRNRGGQLLGEERERNHISIKLPLIEEQLNQMVQDYVERVNQPFLVYGEEIMTRIASDWEEYRATKDLQAEIRKNATFDNWCASQIKASRSSLISLRKTSSVPQFNQTTVMTLNSARQMPGQKKKQAK
ncbi:uncharacterized protein LOC117788521 [Drosophila innubila]|uniref:uncharacterized protein LOC117788521 n=1 Tax=Drosophila innubila TaxID=198719 RepID=UPI00148D1BED|nr:uncharacterized protein LOC117788521 [Drosophila innubila]